MDSSTFDCVWIVQLLAKRRFAQTEAEGGRIETEIQEHLSACRGCSAFYRELQERRARREPEGRIRSSWVADEGGFGRARGSVITVGSVETERRNRMQDLEETQTPETKGKFFTLFIDANEYHVDKGELTGAEIMDLGGIPRELGLILIEEDGTQIQVREDDLIELKPGRRFKKAPRFIRG